MRNIWLAILVLGFSWAGAIALQPPPPASQLVLSLSPSETVGTFHVGLHNMTNAPIRVLLGKHDRSQQNLDAFSLRLTSASGQGYDFVQIDLFLDGQFGLVDEVIPPHKQWTVDMSINEFMRDLHGKSLINPISGDMLPAGSYRLQALFNGTSYPRLKHTLRYWTGTLESNELDYKAPLAGSLQTFMQRPWIVGF
jgi:hypothetical protein